MLKNTNCTDCYGSFMIHELEVAWLLKVMKSQNEYLKSLHCPKYEENIREISDLEDYIDQVLTNVGLSIYVEASLRNWLVCKLTS